MGITKLDRVTRRKRRISKNIIGSKTKPRISVFRSNKYIYAQAIDDFNRLTIVSISSHTLKKDKSYKQQKKTDEAKALGRLFSKLLKEKQIKTGIFDRGRYSYKGRVKAFAEGMREEGFQI